MKEIIRITVALTISCLIAALVMGLTFIFTAKAKKHNEHLNVQRTMLSLLGYTKSDPAPPGLQFHHVYRYIIEEHGKPKYLGYMVPVEEGDRESYEFVVMNLQGNFVEKHQLDISLDEATESPNRKAALKAVLKPPKTFSYGDTTIVATLKDERVAYLLPGEFPGFKTFISVMLALDPKFRIIGLEIMEHEEDPGLGGEIERDYFKKQFKGKPFANVKELKVVKEPLPDEYREYLQSEGMFSKEQINGIRSKYQDDDIYALTGATISSEAVTNGVKNIAKKFHYRLGKLDEVMAGQQIEAAF